MKKSNINEFENIIKDYANHPKVLEMKKYKHHGLTRYDHSYSVAYYTYLITKKLNMNYESATKAALLHDFFFDEVENENGVKRLTNHPKYAVKNAKKYFEINDLEEDIIRHHMFPVTITPPKHKEAWIVDLIDDIISIKDRGIYAKKSINSAINVIVLLFLTIMK